MLSLALFRRTKKILGPLKVVKRHESLLHGKFFCVLMFQNIDTYGVAIIHHNGIAVSPDYHCQGAVLRTVSENIKDIIDWTDVDTADERYLNLVRDNGELHQLLAPKRPKAPSLRVFLGGRV